jgi:Site-specific recombinases, DNA invertase Pin homologs
MNVVGYARLSRDEDRENYSSIETQCDIIYDYAKSQGWIISRIYIDDNYSGFIFDRPAFNEMKVDLKNGKIDIVIAKDLTRIGRHNARTQLFIEENIQDAGKRLILPEERNGYDSTTDDGELLGIFTWSNERYVRDISKKIKANMRKKQEKGELVMGNLYGYLKDNNNKSKLIVDENIRPVVELVFKLYIEGKGYMKICKVLDEKKYPTPSECIRRRHAENGKIFKNAVSDKWQTHNIQRILQDDIYTGVLRTHKKQNKKIKGKQVKVPKAEQNVFENHHESIISKEDFELAQQINSKRKDFNYRGNAKYDYIFSSFVYCGECGFSATGKNIARKPKIERGYECTQYAKYGLDRCVVHSMPEDRIVFFLKEFLKDVKNQYQEYLIKINFDEQKKGIADNLTRIKKECSNLNDELKLLLNQKIKDLLKETSDDYRDIIESNYTELENEKRRKIYELSNRIEELQKVNNKDIEKNIKTAIEIFDSIIESEKPDRKMIETILERINIYHDKSIEFKLLIDISKLTYSQDDSMI